MALKCMGKCGAQPVTPETQATMTNCGSPKTPEDVGAKHSTCAPEGKAASNGTTKPYVCICYAAIPLPQSSGEIIRNADIDVWAQMLIRVIYFCQGNLNAQSFKLCVD